MIHQTASSIIGASWRYLLLSLIVLQERLVLYGGLRDQIGQRSSPATGNLRATRPVPRQELSEIVCCGRLTNCFHAPDHRASSHPRLHLCALPLTSGRNQLLGRITCPRDQTFARFPRRCFCCQRIRIATWVPKSRHSAVCRWCPLHCINYTTVSATVLKFFLTTCRHHDRSECLPSTSQEHFRCAERSPWPAG